MVVALGGIMVGLLIAMFIGKVNQFLVQRTGKTRDSDYDQPADPVCLLSGGRAPGCVGILAAVAAGIAMHYERIVGRMQSATRMQSKAVWDTVQVALNGMIFILLGEQLRECGAQCRRWRRMRGFRAVGTAAVRGDYHLWPGGAAFCRYGLP